MSTESNEDKIRAIGLRYFDLVGFSQAGRPPTLEQYENWLSLGRQGTMIYLERHLEKKANPQLLLPGAKSWIVLVTYYDTQEPLSIELADELKKNQKGWVARYARGEDYHSALSKKHEALIGELQKEFKNDQFLGCVDAQAVLERDAAARAGLGWVGKNTCLINQKLGSFIFLSEILTTVDLLPDKPVADHCGTCSRCLEACPTGALLAPRELDANLCISFWTIESKNPPPADLAGKFGAQFFGCDICQDVCPWNQKSRRQNSLPAHAGPGSSSSGIIDVRELLAQKDEDLKKRFENSALNRAKPQKLKENASRVLKNNAEKA